MKEKADAECYAADALLLFLAGVFITSEFIVRLLIHEGFYFNLAAYFDLSYPALVFRAFVYRCWFLFERVVRFNNLASNRCHNVGSGLHRFNSANRITFGYFCVGLWELDVDDITERLCSVCRDADFAYLKAEHTPI